MPRLLISDQKTLINEKSRKRKKASDCRWRSRDLVKMIQAVVRDQQKSLQIIWLETNIEAAETTVLGT